MPQLLDSSYDPTVEHLTKGAAMSLSNEKTKIYNCTDCNVCARSPFHDLPRDTLQALNDGKSIQRVEPGDVIYNEGDDCDAIYMISNGLVGVRKVDENGNSILLRLEHPGTVIGFRAAIAHTPYTTSAEALAPAGLCVISASVFRRLLDDHPELLQRLFIQSAHDMQVAENSLLSNTTCSVRARIMQLFETLQDRYSCGMHDGAIVIDLPLSRQDLAALMGIRPESLSRVIRSLEEEGIVRFSGRRAFIPSQHMPRRLRESSDLPNHLVH